MVATQRQLRKQTWAGTIWEAWLDRTPGRTPAALLVTARNDFDRLIAMIPIPTRGGEDDPDPDGAAMYYANAVAAAVEIAQSPEAVSRDWPVEVRDLRATEEGHVPESLREGWACRWAVNDRTLWEFDPTAFPSGRDLADSRPV